MDAVLITGSCGLIGSQAVAYYINAGYRVVGIDNDMRAYFFGDDASTKWMKERLQEKYSKYHHYNCDIRNSHSLENIFEKFNTDIKLVIHTAAQPSHDWAAQEPWTDFTINANGTLHLLEFTRRYCPEAVFIFSSTNKVYGDRPNQLPLREFATRWDLPSDHPDYNGIDENFGVDQCLHSLFGASKLSADIVVQEYGRYFGMKTACFRGGCLTGSNHSGTELHGFLSYLIKCALTGEPYTIVGYKGKQVRDNIHSYDLLTAFDEFFKAPKSGAVYNIGGGRDNSCSVLEAVGMTEMLTKKKMNLAFNDQPRLGDHIWYITNLNKFKTDYPGWRMKYRLDQIIKEIYEHPHTVEK